MEKILDARNETSGQNRAMLYNVRGTLAAQLGKAGEAEREYRLADQDIVTDPEIRKAIEGRGIELVSMRNAFTD